MAGNVGLGAGAGIMAGFNQVLIPFLQREGQIRQQGVAQQTAALKQETRNMVEELMNQGLFDDKNPLDAAAHSYLYGDWNAKPPQELSYFLADARKRLTTTADLVGQGSGAVAPAAPPAAPGAPPAPAPPAAPQLDPSQGTPPGTGINMQASMASLQKMGGNPAELATPQVAPPAADPQAAPVPQPAVAAAPAAPEPKVEAQYLDTPEKRAAARIEDRQNRGITDYIKIGNHKLVFTGKTFSDQEKSKANKAYRAILNDVPLEDALATVDDPKLREGLIKGYASEQIRRMTATGLFSMKDAVESLSSQVGRDHIPKEYAEAVFGPGDAANKAVAVQQATMPGNIAQAQGIAAATAPIEVNKAGLIRGVQNEADVAGKPTEDNRIALLLQNQGLQPGTPQYEDAFRAEKAKNVGASAGASAEAQQGVLSRYNPNDIQRAAGRLRIPIPPQGQTYSTEDQRRIQDELIATKATEAGAVTKSQDDAGIPKEERKQTFEERQTERAQNFQQKQQERSQRFQQKQDERAKRVQLRRDQDSQRFRREERQAGQSFQAGQQDERLKAGADRQRSQQKFQMQMAESRIEATDKRQARAQKFQVFINRQEQRQKVALKRLDQRIAQNKPLSPTDIEHFVDPETGDPLPYGMSGRQVRESGARALSPDARKVLQSARTATLVLGQYETAASKVFTSENPNTNALQYYKKWLAANPDYQDLLSESGKLSSIIRYLGEKGALATDDVKRGQDTLLQMRGRVSGSQIKKSVAEVRDLIRSGVTSLGLNGARIIPDPNSAAPAVNLDELP